MDIDTQIFLTLSGVFIGALLSAFVAVKALIQLAPKIGLLDRPNERSSHTRVTPRGGGIGIVATVFLAGVFCFLRFDMSGAQKILWVFLGGSVFIAAISLRDDFKSLGAALRFACHIAAALLLTQLVARFNVLHLPGLGFWTIGIAGIALSVVWIVGMTNVYNFMDGIDGIAGAQAVTGGLAWVAAGLFLDAPLVTVLAAAVAGSGVGFLFHNWSPAKIFMGDVGSAFLGYSFAAMPLLCIAEIHSQIGTSDFLSDSELDRRVASLPIFATLTLWPFISDGFLTFLRRLLNREKVWEPHRSHLYQRLVRSGWSHARVSSVYAVWCVAAALGGHLYLAGRCGVLVALVVAALSLLGMFIFVSRQERAFAAKTATL